VTDPSVPTVIEMFYVAVRSYFRTPASEPTLNNTDEIQEAIMSLKIIKAPGPKCMTYRALKHLPQVALFLLAQIFNAVLLTHHFLKI